MPVCLCEWATQHFRTLLGSFHLAWVQDGKDEHSCHTWIPHIEFQKLQRRVCSLRSLTCLGYILVFFFSSLKIKEGGKKPIARLESVKKSIVLKTHEFLWQSTALYRLNRAVFGCYCSWKLCLLEIVQWKQFCWNLDPRKVQGIWSCSLRRNNDLNSTQRLEGELSNIREAAAEIEWGKCWNLIPQ